ncbi:MAG: EAL domain-containing protein [Turneriella sp.]|nr:EAL domain-containing protein [Turneriella sp.]
MAGISKKIFRLLTLWNAVHSAPVTSLQRSVLQKTPDSFGLVDAEASFRQSFIEKNRGKPLFLLLVENLKDMRVDEFVRKLPDYISRVSKSEKQSIVCHVLGDEKRFLVGIAPGDDAPGFLPNIDAAVGKLHGEAPRGGSGSFHFGIGRTQCNYISDAQEIFDELLRAAHKNLRDNLVRWSWTYLNRANDYFADPEANAVIQPIVYFDPKRELYSVKGGEVFVGGELYNSYAELLRDIPEDQDINRIELLILEKIVMACREAPGLLKFNVSPQMLIETFPSAEKVFRFNELLLRNKIQPQNVRLELVEKPYEEKNISLKDVCRYFYQFGITFAADDFGVKSQSHQVILDLGEMIKEFKLDPISFKFKPEEDQTKFLDNLAFIDYCIRLADNREAIITAEAVDDYDTMRFLIAHQVFYFQSHIFCRKLPIHYYRENFHRMQNLPEDIVRKILSDDDLLQQQKEMGNIFELARQLKMV